MKSLNEHLKRQLNEAHIKDPKPHTIAWDNNGTPVEIISVLQGGDEDEDEFVKDYDVSGVMTNMLDDLRDDVVAGNVTLVAVKLKGGSNRETAVYVWGPEGVCYENK